MLLGPPHLTGKGLLLAWAQEPQGEPCGKLHPKDTHIANSISYFSFMASFQLKAVKESILTR